MSPSNTPTHGRRVDPVAVYFVAQVLAGLLVVFIVCLVHRSTRTTIELLVLFLLGIPFTQVTLLATWNALGDGRRAIHPIGSLLCLIVIWLADFGTANWVGLFGQNIGIPGIAMFVQWILVQIPLWYLRGYVGWHIGPVSSSQGAPGVTKVQFGIKHLLVWTAIVATVLGLSKSLMQVEWARSSEVAGFALFLVCNSLFAWPTVLGSMTNRWTLVALATACGFAIVVSVAEPFVFQALLGRGHPEGFFWLLNSIQFVWLVGSMLVLRRMGFGLVRWGPGAEPPGSTTA